MGLLENKVALITGAGSGIGQGIAKKFAEEGARVVIDYIGQPQGADDTLNMVKNAGSTGIIVEADVTRTSDIKKVIDAAYHAFGELSILVNNAGIEKKAPFTEVAEADYEQVLAVNLKGPFFLTQYFVQRLLAAKQARPNRQHQFRSRRYGISRFFHLLHQQRRNAHVYAQSVCGTWDRTISR